MRAYQLYLDTEILKHIALYEREMLDAEAISTMMLHNTCFFEPIKDEEEFKKFANSNLPQILVNEAIQAYIDVKDMQYD